MINILNTILSRKTDRTTNIEQLNYIIGEKTILFDTAKIINNLNDKSKINIGNYCYIRGELATFGHGGMIEIGNYCYVGINSHIWSAKKIIIGNRVLISHNCNIFDSDTHPFDPVLRHKQFKSMINGYYDKIMDLHEEEVIIHDDVLIGANSTILKGVTINKRSIVGAGSVVVKNVPKNCIVAGNPAKIIKHLSY